MMRAVGAALVLVGIRWGYARIRSEEGLGLGDIKLAAAGGAWLALASIPFWLGLASTAALVVVVLARLRGQAIHRTTRIPLGAFLCPALWLVFFLSAFEV
jgi:leader peptidase (prepilin peptidase)/N-methyltransferase